MTPSADLRQEVLERMAELGRGRRLTVSIIARHQGDDRSVPAVWDVLEQLYVDEVVERPEFDTYVLPIVREVGGPTHDQTSFEDGGPTWPG